MKVLFLLLIFLFQYSFAQFDFVAGKNVTLSNSQQYQFRNFLISQIINTGFYDGVFFTSTSFQANNLSRQLDVVSGSAYVGQGIFPTAVISFFDAMSTWNGATNNGNPFNFNAQDADTIVGKGFISLDEVNSNNVTVQTISLNSLTWTILSTQPQTNGKGLQWVTFQGVTNKFPNFNVQFTVVFSQVLGLLNVVGNPVITPKTLETILNITNFPYKSTADSVRLNMVIGMGMASLSIQGTANFTSGSGNSGSFVHFSNQVQTDGNTKTATITVMEQANGQMGSTLIDAQIVAKFSTSHSIMFVSATFPAGAVNIVYDPQATVGADPPNYYTTTTGGAHNVTPIIALLFLALMFLI